MKKKMMMTMMMMKKMMKKKEERRKKKEVGRRKKKEETTFPPRDAAPSPTRRPNSISLPLPLSAFAYRLAPFPVIAPFRLSYFLLPDAPAPFPFLLPTTLAAPPNAYPS